MSISLLNDSGYAYHVTKHLVKMGEVLFATGASQLREAERSVSLDKQEPQNFCGKPTARTPIVAMKIKHLRSGCLRPGSTPGNVNARSRKSA